MARRPKFDDDEILDRAMDHVWRSGWAATSIRDLEQVLDLKAPSIYRRFGTKSGVGVAVIDHYVDRVIRRRVRRHLPGTGDPLANIERFLVSSVTEGDDGERLRGCLITTTALDGARLDSEVAAALARGRAVIDDGLRREVERAAALGLLAEGVEPPDATASVTVTAQGLLALARSGEAPAALQARARAVVSVIAAPPPTGG